MKNDILGAFNLIWKISNKRERFYLVSLLFLSVLRTIRPLITPLILTCIISKISNEPAFFICFTFPKELSTISVIFILMLIYYIVAIIESLIRALVKLYSTKMMGKMNTKAIDWVLEFRKNMELDLTKGEINYIIKNASENVGTFLENTIVDFIVPLLSSIIAIVYISAFEILTLPILLGSLAMISLLIYFRMFRDKKVFATLEKISEKTSNNSLNVIENLPFISFIKSKKVEIQIEKNLNDLYYKEDKKRIATYIFYWLGIYLIQTISFVLILWFAIKKSVSTSEIINSTIVIFTYLNNIFSYITTFGYTIGQIQQKGIKICRINLLIAKKEDLIEKNIELPKNLKIKKISLKNYSFNIGNIIHKNINFDFNLGQINCIYGKSGCGKSALINCILGLYSYNKGNLIINDQYEIPSLFFENKKVSVALQDKYLFDRSIESNISYPDTKLSKKALNLVKLFNLQKLLKREENCKNNFSGGEQRRFCFVRCLSKNADVYILDEPTNDLDESNVDRLIKLLERLKKKSIIIIISHDTRLIKIAENKLKLKV